jgi:WD repeat-containing protein 19
MRIRNPVVGYRYQLWPKLLVCVGKAASCGDNTVKIHELTDLKDTSHVLSLDDERGLDNMDWSEDGQLLAVSTTKVRVT